MTDPIDPAAATRTERDSMGEMSETANARYGASTQRAVQNYTISGQRYPLDCIAYLDPRPGAFDEPAFG